METKTLGALALAAILTIGVIAFTTSAIPAHALTLIGGNGGSGGDGGNGGNGNDGHAGSGGTGGNGNCRDCRDD